MIRDLLNMSRDRRGIANDAIAIRRHQHDVVVQHEIVLLDVQLGLLATLLILDRDLELGSSSASPDTTRRQESRQRIRISVIGVCLRQGLA